MASGHYSVAMGEGNTSSGGKSVAMGYNNTASETGAVAMGTDCSALGLHSIATGYKNTADGVASFAAGQFMRALGLNSIAMGSDSTADASFAIALGHDGTTASGHSSVALGWGCIASGRASFADGSGCTATGDSHVAMGHNSHTDPSNVFVYSLGDSSWAFGFDADNSGCLKYNGQVIASENYEQWQREGELLKPLASDVSGIQLLNTIIRGTDLSGITIGDGNMADASYAVAMGYNNTASGAGAVAMGLDNSANYNCAVAMGSSNVVHGDCAVAMGWKNTAGWTGSGGSYAIALGGGCIASGKASFANGSGCNANGDYHVAFGNAASTDPSNVFVYSLGDSSWAFGFDADNSGCLKYNGQVIASENYEQWQREGELLKPLASDVSGIQLLNTIIRGTDLSGITIGDDNSASGQNSGGDGVRQYGERGGVGGDREGQLRLRVNIRWRWGITALLMARAGSRWAVIVRRRWAWRWGMAAWRGGRRQGIIRWRWGGTAKRWVTTMLPSGTWRELIPAMFLSIVLATACFRPQMLLGLLVLMPITQVV